MPTFDYDFQKLFQEAAGEPVIYRGERIQLAHKIAVCHSGRLLITIESTASPLIQGIAIQEDVIGIEERRKRTIVYEHYSVPPERRHRERNRLPFSFEFEQKGNSDELLLFNVARREDGGYDYWTGGCALRVEPLENGVRLHCNDPQLNDDFTDLVFRVECLPPKQS